MSRGPRPEAEPGTGRYRHRQVKAGPVGQLHGRRSRRGDCARLGGSGRPGVDAGLTQGTRPDLGLVVSQQTSAAAGRFTAHPFASAPVRWSRDQLRSGMARAVLVHAGSANAATVPRATPTRPPWPPAARAPSAARPARCCSAAPGRSRSGWPWPTPPRPPTRPPPSAGAGRAGRQGHDRLDEVAREHARRRHWSEGEVRIGGAAKAWIHRPAFDHPRDPADPDPPGA